MMETGQVHKPDGVVLLRRPRPPKAIKKSAPQQVPSLKHFLNSSAATTPLDSERSHISMYGLYPRGPDFFPPGKKLHASIPLYRDEMECVPDEIHLATPRQAFFTLNDFLVAAEEMENKMPISKSKGMISRQNYIKLTSWFSKNVTKQKNPNTCELEIHHQAPLNRVPRKQVLIELQVMVDNVLKESASNIGDRHSSASSMDPRLIWPPHKPDDILFRSATSRFFCGEGRSNSPFDARHQPYISPSEVAILGSMLNGGTHLSLKAHFISSIPLLSPLVHTLTYLNLSFNCIQELPHEIFHLHSLIFLTLRNNPLRVISNDISNLYSLRFLCLSFCILSNLPPGLYTLQNLVVLDVSYNNLSSLSRNIFNLKNLSKLNIEGNQLTGLPSTTLSLRLHHITLGNNLMHPILWKENARNQPQTLVDLCCVQISGAVGDRSNYGQLPSSVKVTLEGHFNGLCDECKGMVFGSGLRVIRGVKHRHFKVKNLPFIFIVCSPLCRRILKRRDAGYWLEESRPQSSQ